MYNLISGSISIHPPHAGRDHDTTLSPRVSRGFQSTLPMRGGTANPDPPANAFVFQSTLPMRGGTAARSDSNKPDPFQSTLPMRGGTSSLKRLLHQLEFQSTLPMRGGTGGHCLVDADIFISIHPPHAGRDAQRSVVASGNSDFNPPSPCGEGRRLVHILARIFLFQSTLPMRGGTSAGGNQTETKLFQSTLPMRGGTP